MEALGSYCLHIQNSVNVINMQHIVFLIIAEYIDSLYTCFLDQLCINV